MVCPRLQHDGPIKCLAWVPEKGYLITAGWDATLRYWDPRAGTTPQATVALPERAYAMDVKGGNAMVLATADKFLHVFDLAKPTVPFRSMESPLKLQVSGGGKRGCCCCCCCCMYRHCHHLLIMFVAACVCPPTCRRALCASSTI